jgi:hypothetical protein
MHTLNSDVERILRAALDSFAFVRYSRSKFDTFLRIEGYSCEGARAGYDVKKMCRCRLRMVVRTNLLGLFHLGQCTALYEVRLRAAL